MENSTMAQGPAEGPNNNAVTTTPVRGSLRGVAPTPTRVKRTPGSSKVNASKNGNADEDESDPEYNDLQPKKRVKKEQEGAPLPRPGLIVGCHREDSEVPVVAFLTSSLALKYRLSKQEATDSKIEFKHQQCPTQAQVKFLPEYTGDDKKIRDSIKKKLKETFPEYRDKEEIAAGDDIVPNEDIDAATMELRQVIEAQQAAGKELSEQLLNTIIAQRAAILEEQDTVKSQKTRITNLESQVERLTAQVDQLNQSVLLNQNQKLVIDGRTYDKFPAGNVNEGLFVTKQPHVVTIDDVVYSETTVLSQFKSLELGGTLIDVVTLAGIPFKRIAGGTNDGKLVQELGPHSILVHEGNYYVRTYIRTEKPLSL